jgi:hypothetical protein
MRAAERQSEDARSIRADPRGTFAPALAGREGGLQGRSFDAGVALRIADGAGDAPLGYARCADLSHPVTGSIRATIEPRVREADRDALVDHETAVANSGVRAAVPDVAATLSVAVPRARLTLLRSVGSDTLAWERAVGRRLTQCWRRAIPRVAARAARRQRTNHEMPVAGMPLDWLLTAARHRGSHLRNARPARHWVVPPRHRGIGLLLKYCNDFSQTIGQVERDVRPVAAGPNVLAEGVGDGVRKFAYRDRRRLRRASARRRTTTPTHRRHERDGHGGAADPRVTLPHARSVAKASTASKETAVRPSRVAPYCCGSRGRHPAPERRAPRRGIGAARCIPPVRDRRNPTVP